MPLQLARKDSERLRTQWASVCFWPYADAVQVQGLLLAKVRQLCLADEWLDAALMYGLFAAGEAGEHSDVEFWLFFEPARRRDIAPRV